MFAELKEERLKSVDLKAEVSYLGDELRPPYF